MINREQQIWHCIKKYSCSSRQLSQRKSFKKHVPLQGNPDKETVALHTTKNKSDFLSQERHPWI